MRSSWVIPLSFLSLPLHYSALSASGNLAPSSLGGTGIPLTDKRIWWGDYAMSEGEALQWLIGPFRLQVERRALEWRVAHRQEGDVEADALEVAHPMGRDQMDESASLARYVFSHTSERLRLAPMLADRPVVTRPLQPFHILPGETVTIYVSSPVWLRMDVGEANRSLLETPLQRPSDTWFGPSTQLGQLCYASQTHCRLYLDEMPIRPHRAVTPVCIRNRARNTLVLERLNLPVDYLALYGTPDGLLWTQGLTMHRESDLDLASVDIDKRPPEQAAGQPLLAPPRQRADRGVLTWALSALFG